MNTKEQLKEMIEFGDKRIDKTFAQLDEILSQVERQNNYPTISQANEQLKLVKTLKNLMDTQRELQKEYENTKNSGTN